MRYVAFFFLLFMLFLGSPGISAAQIRLNEILADPASDWDGDGQVDSRGDEWIEITNVGTTPLELSSYRLGDESGGYKWRYGFSGTLYPGAVMVIYGSQALAWQGGSGFPAYGLSLNNAGDTVYLYRLSGADTIAVDSYSYSSTEVQDDRSVGRNPDGTGSWSMFDGLNPYSGAGPPYSTGCNPTPGGSNGCSTPTEKGSWGSIKSLYGHH